ncbi:uncharacterized protein DNG_04718 [Cephalotrichum gorgonifer]|uniref:Uncharacterized protein n=1 Tax=Cephalotrichum gorgonifer TaxID=2041049 RepID=A0AAE8MX65_9PEZI|nr:uncharacterized protein DNG_04718 [Cephalotrichum gorgonifer]
MASTGQAFSQTLKEITSTKLNELSKRYSSFEEAKLALLSSLKSEDDPISRLERLSAGIKKCLSIKVDKSGVVVAGNTKHSVEETKLKNFDRFFAQARYDPSVSAEMIKSWESVLLERLEMQSLKFQYASLYGKLVTEWLSADQVTQKRKRDDSDSRSNEATKKARTESREVWQSFVFSESSVDPTTIRSYLDELFGAQDPENSKPFNALKRLRSLVEQFEITLSTPGQFSKESLTWAIDGLLSSGLITGDDRDVLKGFKSNPVILAEIADVLNMRLHALDSWSWGDEVTLEQTRKISGVYNIHMHEDILQAIFLQVLGIKWSVFFKNSFGSLRQFVGAWKPMGQGVSPEEKARLAHYLGPMTETGSLRKMRENIYGKRYFMAHLRDIEGHEGGAAEGEEEVDYSMNLSLQAQQPMMQQQMMQQQAMKMRALQQQSAQARAMAIINDDGDLDDADMQSPLGVKQRLLHLLATEIDINTRLHGELTAFHFVFESWNPLLPHETILAVLDFFGVSATWRTFFSKFLRAPLKWADAEDGTEPRIRRRGTPALHALSEVFGETVLFCLDFAVNQSTNGNVLWRVHDDAWLWSPSHAVAVKAWKTVQDFAAVTGVSIDSKKAGSVRISKDRSATLPIDESLPAGPIRWGFLVLSPETGRFEIDDALVNTHIQELQRQLRGSEKSIFSFIQTWNSYAATFFSSNFGIPANCFGRGHVDKMLETHNRIQKEVFSGSGDDDVKSMGSVVAYLKKILSDRFAVENTPDGFFYFPAELGGLDLKSPFITLLQIRDSVPVSSTDIFSAVAKSEREAYEREKTAYIGRMTNNIRYDANNMHNPGFNAQHARDQAAASTKFLSFAEFIKYREEFNFRHSFQVSHAFKRLMAKPMERSIDLDDSLEISNAIPMVEKLLSESPGKPRSVDAYWKWVMMMYGPEVYSRFGGLSIVEQGLLPMGMVSIFKETRVEWQG